MVPKWRNLNFNHVLLRFCPDVFVQHKKKVWVDRWQKNKKAKIADISAFWLCLELLPIMVQSTWSRLQTLQVSHEQPLFDRSVADVTRIKTHDLVNSNMKSLKNLLKGLGLTWSQSAVEDFVDPKLFGRYG